MIAELKPYPAYKDSGVEWLGKVPEHWEIRRIKTLLRERCEKGFPDEPLLAATQTKGVVRKEQYENRTVLALKDLHLLKLVHVDDFVISLRSFQGGIEYAREQGIISPAYTILYPIRSEIHAFLAWLLKSQPYIENLSLFVTGIRQGQNIDYEKLSRSSLSLPPLSEQSAIVRYLDYMDRRIRRYVRSQEKLVKLLEEQKKAIIHQAVTRGLNPNVRFKPSGVEWLGEIPEHWNVVPVKRCSETISKGTTPSTEKREILDFGPVRFLKAENIASGKIVNKPLCFIDEASNTILRRSQLKEGDILFVIAGATLGKIAVVDKTVLPANMNQAIAFIRPNSLILSNYLAFGLQSPRVKELIWLNAVQSAQPNLSMADLGNFVISLPPTIEQKEILLWLDHNLMHINAMIENSHRKISLLREYRTRLIADVVTGKLDVRAIAAQLPQEAEEKEEIEIPGKEELPENEGNESTEEEEA